VSDVRVEAERAVAAFVDYDEGDGSEEVYEDTLAAFHHVATPWAVLKLLDALREIETDERRSYGSPGVMRSPERRSLQVARLQGIARKAGEGT
jgi:hypothetical protein